MRKSFRKGNRTIIYDAVPEGKDVWIDIVQVQENGRPVDISYGEESTLAYILQGVELEKNSMWMSDLFERLGNKVSADYWRAK